MDESQFTPEAVKAIGPRFFSVARASSSSDQMRKDLAALLFKIELETSEDSNLDAATLARIRDTSQVFRNMLKKRSDDLAGFSMAQALYDIARDRSRPDLTPAFYADLYHLILGIQGLGSRKALDDWQDWRWQVKNIVRDPSQLRKLVKLSREEKAAVNEAVRHKLPFGITPYYLSLMDDERSRRDISIRAQVLPPADYVAQVTSTRKLCSLDFMGEEDTSPYDLITRRYPAICILKPFNTCPQICVYCQRNWEIDDAMAKNAFAGMKQIDAAIGWIKAHPTIHEVLITGGDPLAMGDATFSEILARVAVIPTVHRIRIGSRIPVTMPMRITADLVDSIAQYRELGKKEVAVATHVQHPYEITPELATAVSRFRSRGIPVYNQLVYTYFISKRFQAAALRRHLRLVGIDPYYTFNTKGKDETLAYRVPISRLVQEQQEEARLLPGLERTDEAVFNVPRLGKNYLKSREHRDLLSILPNGARVYEFYSWEKNISDISNTYTSIDIPILNYLKRLEKDGEARQDYDTIWYYF